MGEGVAVFRISGAYNLSGFNWTRSIDTFVTHLFSLVFPCLLYVIHQNHLEIADLIDQRRQESKPNTSSSFPARVDGTFFLPQLLTSRVGSFSLLSS